MYQEDAAVACSHGGSEGDAAFVAWWRRAASTPAREMMITQTAVSQACAMLERQGRRARLLIAPRKDPADPGRRSRSGQGRRDTERMDAATGVVRDIARTGNARVRVGVIGAGGRPGGGRLTSRSSPISAAVLSEGHGERWFRHVLRNQFAALATGR